MNVTTVQATCFNDIYPIIFSENNLNIMNRKKYIFWVKCSCRKPQETENKLISPNATISLLSIKLYQYIFVNCHSPLYCMSTGLQTTTTHSRADDSNILSKFLVKPQRDAASEINVLAII